MNKYVGLILSPLLLTACYVSAQVINFDDVPDGTDISSHYAGLTFSCAGVHCASPSVFARLTANAFSSPNTVSLPKTGNVFVQNEITGTIKVQVACLATKATVQARSVPVVEPLNLVQHAILVAENSSGVEVGQMTGTRFDQFELLTVNSPTNLIATIRLGVEGTGVAAVAQFDDLSIECAPTVIYPPWTIVVVIIIVLFVVLAVFALWRRKHR